MALRPRGVSRPPAVSEPALAAWLQEISEAIEGLPFSYFSSSDGPNTSGVTAPIGTLGVEIGSSGTKLWIKRSDGTTGWASVATA